MTAMPCPLPAVAAGPGVAAEFALRRALLAASRDDAVAQDRIDCAELAFTSGLRDVAATLYGIVFLELGFAPAALSMQREVAARTGLWDDLPPVEHAPPPAGFSVDLAIVELRRLMRVQPVLGPAPADIGAMLPADMLAPTEPRPDAAQRLAELAASVAAELRALPDRAARGAIAEMLRGFAATVVALRPILLEEHLGTPVGTLAALFALERVRRFLLVAQDLLDAVAPAAALFDEASRLDPGALGPYFTNVRLVIRNVRDIFGLIEVAAGRRPDDDAVECWCVLMSGHLARGETLELIDELGDRGMTRAMRVLLGRCARSGAIEKPRDIVWRIRDVAIDVGDLRLAADAQHLIALWSPTDDNEWNILGELRASFGDREGAEAAFGRGLVLRPDGGEAKERLAKLRSGAVFLVDRGYGTSPGRFRLRRARLEAFGKAG